MSASAFEQRIRTLLPGLQNRPFELCTAKGSPGDLVVLEASSPPEVKFAQKGSKSALYVRLLVGSLIGLSDIHVYEKLFILILLFSGKIQLCVC